MLKRRILEPATSSKTTGEILTFAALSGLRSMAPPALLARAIRRGDVPDPKGTPYEILGRLSPLLQILMVGEMVGDKTPFIPSRTSAGPLLGRAASGALVAAALRASGGRGGKRSAALLGALSAVAAAFAGENLRAQGAQRLGGPDLALALLEDGLVLYAGTRLLRRANSR